MFVLEVILICLHLFVWKQTVSYLIQFSGENQGYQKHLMVDIV